MTAYEMAVASATATYEVLKVAVAARDQAKIDAALSTLQKELMDALNTGVSTAKALHALELETQQLRTEKLELERQKQAAEAEMERRASYDLVQPAPGRWAYVREGTAAGAPDKTAYFCPACHAEKREVPMQYREAAPSIPNRLTCPNDKGHTLYLGGALPPQTLQAFGIR